MRKVKAYMHALAHSFIPYPHFYGTLTRARFSSSFIFFLITFFLFSYIYILLSYSKIIPPREFLSDYAIAKSLSTFPQNLAVYIDQGHLQASTDRPTFFWMEINHTKNPLLVIDDRASIDMMNAYNAQVLFTESEAAYRNYKDSKLQFVQRFNTLFFGPNYQKVLAIDKSYTKNDLIIIPFKNSTVIRKNMITQNVYGLSNVIANPLSLIQPVLVNPLSIIAYTLIVILVTSGLIFLLQPHRRKNLHIHYPKIVQVSLHAATLPLVILLLLQLLYPATNHLLTYAILIFIFSITAVYEAYYNHGRS